jgi:uncharacterized OB-fold protein
MKCPNCGRRPGWARVRCPACRTKLAQWYVVATVVVIAACYAGLLIAERIL